MRELATSDAVFAIHHRDDSRFALLHNAGVLPADLVEQISGRENLDHLRLYGRSVLGQMGVNVVPTGPPEAVPGRHGVDVYTPVEVTTHSSIGQAVLSDLQEMRDNKKRPG